jgi:hypothetical protein
MRTSASGGVTMGEKKRRQARAGVVREEVALAPAPDAARVNSMIEAASPSGPAQLLRDLEGWRLAHMLANDAEATGSCFAAFEALASCGAFARDEIDTARSERGEAPVHDLASEMPTKSVRVPAWALIAVCVGWAKVKGFAGRDGRREPTLPVVEAFGLGGAGGGRTVADNRRTFARNVRIAIAVAEQLASGQAHSENAAVLAAAAAHAVSRSVAYSAWCEHAEPARRFVAGRASGALSESGQPADKP